MPNLCFSPPDNLIPLSPTIKSSPLLILFTKSNNSAPLNESITFVSLMSASCSPNAIFLLKVSSNKKISCGI